MVTRFQSWSQFCGQADEQSRAPLQSPINSGAGFCWFCCTGSSETHTHLTAVKLLWHEIAWNRQSSEGQHGPVVLAGLIRSDLILTQDSQKCSMCDTSTCISWLFLFTTSIMAGQSHFYHFHLKRERKSEANMKSPVRGPRKNQKNKEESSRTPPGAPCSLLLSTTSLEISFPAHYLTSEYRP